MFTPKQRWLLFSALLLLLGLIRDLLLNLLADAIQLDSSARGWLLAGIVLLLVGTLAMSYRHWQLESDASALSKPIGHNYQ